MKNQLKNIKGSLLLRKKSVSERVRNMVKCYNKYLIIRSTQKLCGSNILSIFFNYMALFSKSKTIQQNEEMRILLISRISVIHPCYLLKGIDLFVTNCFRDFFKLNMSLYENRGTKLGLTCPLPILLLIGDLLVGMENVQKLLEKIVNKFTKNKYALHIDLVFPPQFAIINTTIIKSEYAIIKRYYIDCFLKCLL